MTDVAILICTLILAFFTVAVIVIIRNTRALRRDRAELTARIERERAEYEERRRQRTLAVAQDEAERRNRRVWMGNETVPTNGADVNFWEDLRTFAESVPPKDGLPKTPEAARAITPNVMPQKRGNLSSTAVPKTPRKNAAPKTAHTTSSPGYIDGASPMFIASAPSYSDSGSSSCDSSGGGGGCD
jgi:hypothetical protein